MAAKAIDFRPWDWKYWSGPAPNACSGMKLKTKDGHHASRTKTLEDVLGHIGILIAAVALSVTVYLSYRYAPGITRKISPQTIRGIVRVIAFILLCIGVQIAWRGVQTLIQSVAK